MQYREVLYSNYHSTQSGRASGVDKKTLFEREKRQFSREIIPLLQNRDKEIRIFDMGCGSGSLLKALQEAGFKNSHGLDISEEQVKIAAEMGVANVAHGDALEYVRNQNQQADLLCGMDIIEHFTKDELVDLLKNVQQFLAPKGLAIFRTPNLDGILSTVFANGDFTHENYLNCSSAQQVCLASGFSEVSVLPGLMRIENPVKEMCRRILWPLVKLQWKVYLFATARSSKNVLLSPNMLIIARR